MSTTTTTRSTSNTVCSSLLPWTSSCTILWSTQGGRAKACARRTARLIRDQQYHQYQQATSNPPPDSSSSSLVLLPDGYYGSSFDDYGPLEFFKLGNHHHEPSSTATTNHKDTAATDQEEKRIHKQRHKNLVIMFVSTTGDAEQCDSVKETWKQLLQKNIPSHQFQCMTFAMFCLGDRAYGPMAFCAAGRKLAARLVQLGAMPFCDMGYGDDGTPNGGVFYDLDVWTKDVLLPAMFGNESRGGKRMEERGVEEDYLGLVKQGRDGGVWNMRQSFLPQSPYCVNLSEKKEHGKDKKDACDEKNVRETCHEWQRDRRCMESYGNFFSSQCPSTCYFYKEENGTRMPGSQDMSRQDDPRQGTPLLGCMVSNQRITAKEWMQDTRHLRIHVKTSSSRCTSGKAMSWLEEEEGKPLLPYQAGDIATIAPCNPEKVVQRFLSCLPRSIQKIVDYPLDIDTNITASTQYSSSFIPWPNHATLRGILTYCADICSLPEREDLRALSFYCNPNHPMGVDQRKKLLSLSETSDAALYGDYVLREKRNWADVLFDFDSIQFEQEEEEGRGDDGTKPMNDMCYIPLSVEHLLMILPPIVPRHFSIASAPSSSVDTAKDTRGYNSRNGIFGFDLELCVAVVQGKTRYGREYQGLCSSYLANLECSNSYDIRLWVKPGSFGKLPLDTDDVGQLKTPIMCIGAGTGVAPLRSLLLEREAYRKLASLNHIQSPNNDGTRAANILVFGCRKPTMDFYYKKEWEVLQRSGNLRLLMAFSQNQGHKIYVQKIVREADDGVLISRHILESGGAVYIAGSAKMARAVKDEIIESLGKHLPLGEKGARELLQKLQRRGRFCVEAWS
jgi:Sulfite reductase, alpha subunit (flavoprotein)